MHACMHTYIHTYMHTCIYIYIYIYNIYIYICSRCLEDGPRLWELRASEGYFEVGVGLEALILGFEPLLSKRRARSLRGPTAERPAERPAERRPSGAEPSAQASRRGAPGAAGPPATSAGLRRRARPALRWLRGRPPAGRPSGRPGPSPGPGPGMQQWPFSPALAELRATAQPGAHA